VGQEKGPQTHDHNYVKSQPILGFFTGRFLSKYVVKWILKSQRTLYMLLHHLVNIWLSYKQERGCLVHFAHLATTLLKDEESARDNNVLACNFAKYLPIKNSLIDSATNLS